MYMVKQSSTARPLLFLMVDSTDHVTPKTGLSPTVTISKNGGSFASPSGSVTEIANGWYQVAGNATDTATLGVLALHATGTAADPTDSLFEVVAFDPSDSVRLGLTALPNAAAAGTGGLHILGSNTAKPTYAAGVEIAQSTSNGSGLSITGNGAGAAVLLTGGSTGEALKAIADAASVFNITASTTGHGVEINANGSSKHGIQITGGSGGTSDGIKAVAGTGGVPIRGNITGNLTGTINGLTATALDQFFSVNSGTTYASAVSGSVVKEIASNAGGGTPPTVGAIADAVWDEVLSGHLTSGTTGFALNAAGSAGDPWATTVPGAYSSGTAGYIVGTNINATVSSRLAPTTAGRTLDVTTTGEAGIDWSNVGAPTTTLNLSATTIGTANTIGSTGLAAIWDRATSLITTAGSIGKLIIDKLGIITSKTTITTNGLISTGTSLTIFQGETINSASGNLITMSVPPGTLNLTGFTPKFGITKVTADSGTSTLVVTGTVNSAGLIGQSVTFALTSAQTAALALSTGGVLAGGMYANPSAIYAYRWEISATDGSSNCPTLGTGYVDVKPRGTTC